MTSQHKSHRHLLTNSDMRIDEVKEKDNVWKEIVKKERKRRTVKADSDLSNFIVD